MDCVQHSIILKIGLSLLNLFQVGPATMGLHSGSELFFITSSAQTLCMILLHTFWSVIFFNAVDNKKILHIAYVVVSHMFVSVLTLLNRNELYAATLLPSYAITIFSAYLALRVAGGSMVTIKRFVTCQ